MSYKVGNKTIQTRIIPNLFGQDAEVIRIDDLPAKVRREFQEYMKHKALIYHDLDWWAFFKVFRQWYEKERRKDDG